MSAQKKTLWAVHELLSWATSHFDAIGVEASRLEAEVILAHVLGTERVALYLDCDYFLSCAELRRCVDLFSRKSNREPVSYIIGYKEFWSLNFEVNNSVLIPRPETECLVSSVIPLLRNNSSCPMKILDVGTGSGAIAVALASEAPSHQFYALDVSRDAIHIAKKNAVKNKINNIVFLLSHWIDALRPRLIAFDLVVSNPPYIKSSVLDSLQPEVVLHEPALALDGGQDGLECFRQVISDSLLCLCPGGLLALEIGSDQGYEVSHIANLCGGYSDIKIIKDYSGLDRVVHMTKN